MIIKIEHIPEVQYQKDFHALDLGFVHRNGVGETGWDRFMTGGIATIGSSPFALFRPNHTILVIDEKRILRGFWLSDGMGTRPEHFYRIVMRRI